MNSFTVISGGQTGVDLGALEAAWRAKLPLDGWIPAGRLTEAGPLSARYPLKETPSALYAQRTEWNVRDSDGTLIICPDKPTGGTLTTIRMAEKWNRPHLVISPLEDDAAARILSWIGNLKPERLNFAGPRESTCPGIQELTRELLGKVFAEIQGQMSG